MKVPVFFARYLLEEAAGLSSCKIKGIVKSAMPLNLGSFRSGIAFARCTSSSHRFFHVVSLSFSNLQLPFDFHRASLFRVQKSQTSFDISTKSP